MVKPTIYSTILKPPRAIGISRRLLITLLCMVFGILILFFVFLHHYSARPVMANMATEIHTEAATEAMQAIESHAESSGVVKVSAKDIHREVNSSPVQLSSAVLQTGGDAPINVYHTSVSLAPPQSKTTHHPNTHTSPYIIRAGTMIPATLLTGINSELPGTLIAKVRQSVFDTATGNYLLIPQGATLLGHYDHHILMGQSRVLIVWQRLMMPDGSVIKLQQFPGADAMGASGLTDRVNHHYLHIFGSSLLFSVFGALGQLSQTHNNNPVADIQQVMAASVGQQLSQTAMQWVAKNMAIQPTITIRPGANFNVLVTQDVVLSAPYAVLD